MSQAEMRRKINDEIVAALRAGTPPWRRGWTTDISGGLPRNALTRAKYSGINVLLLLGAQMRWAFTSSRWASYQQWSQLGGQVRRRPDNVPAGEWGTKIVVFKPAKKLVRNTDGDQEERAYCFMKWYTLFNEDQIDGLPIRPAPAVSYDFTDYQPAEEAFRATGADIRHTDEGRAYYSRPGDFIVMPHRHRFVSPAEYYCTLAHELGHWAESRLGWTGTYALGELRAEITACYLASEIGIPQSDDRSNSAAYLGHWLREMQGDPGVIFRVASASSLAADYILSFSRPECPSPDVLDEVMTGGSTPTEYR